MTRNPPKPARRQSEADSLPSSSVYTDDATSLAVPGDLTRLFTEHEAAHAGAGTVDRSQHEVYRQIKGRSRPGATGYGQLFSMENTPIDSTLVHRPDIPGLVRELEARRMIAALPCFEFQADAGWLDVRVYWVARVEHSGVADNNAARVFFELCELSAKAAGEWLRSMEGADRVCEGLLRDLEHNLQPGAAGGEGYTPGEMRQWQTDSEFAVFFDPERVLGNTRLDHRPTNQIMRVFAENVRRELSRNRIGIDMGAPGFLPYQSQSVIAYFETARDFLEARVIPEYLGDRAIKRKLDQISLQEALHDIEIERADTGRFSKARAEILRRGGFRGGSEAPGGLAPGQLAVEVVLRLGALAEQAYQDRWNDRCRFFVDEFVRGLRMHGGDYKRMLRFVPPQEFVEQTPEIWEQLLRHPDLIHATCESRQGTAQVFALRDTMVFRHLVATLKNAPPGEHWRIAGFRRLMLAAANSDFTRGLKADPEIAAGYERLVRILYGWYVPAYMRWLYWLPVRPIVEYLDRRAGRALGAEERRHQNVNQNQMDRLRGKAREAKREEVLNAKGAAIVAEIVTELQSHYFERMRIPSVAEVVNGLARVDRETLMALFRKAGFTILKKISARRHGATAPAADPFEQGILLFPRDSAYAGRAQQILELCRGILASARQAGPQTSGAGSFTPDQTQLDRARRLDAFLARQRSHRTETQG
ncbi:MAG: hypothetical protein RIF32_07990 [Leptospirales bacterium]